MAERTPTTPRFGRERLDERFVEGRLDPEVWVPTHVALEDRPERSGEICAAEVFGSSIRDGHAEVGLGINRFREFESEVSHAAAT